MYRQIIIPQKTNFTIHLPEDFVGKEVELIAFTLKETETGIKVPFIDETIETSLHGFKFDREDALNDIRNNRLDWGNFKFDREEANER